MNRPFPGRYTLPLLALLCLLTRLPQLLSPQLLLDGDECVLATMAKYLYQGKDHALFFWGQNYGFSLVESAAIVPFYCLFGFRAIAVKLAMLSLWTTGVLFFYKALLAAGRGKGLLPLLVTLLLIASPAWAVWSMKARGGYLTAFLLSNLTLYLLLAEKHYRRPGTYAWIGGLIQFIYQSQPFFLALVLPLAIYRLVQERSLVKATLLLVPLGLLLLGFHYYKAAIPDGYAPVYAFPDDSALLLARIRRLPEYIYGSLHGNYYFAAYQRPNFFCACYAVLTSLAVYGLAGVSLVYLLFRRRGRWLFLSAASSLWLIACYALFTREPEGRYLLPLTGAVLFALFLLLRDMRRQRAIVWSMGGISLTGVIALITFWQFRFLPYGPEELNRLIAYLERQGIHYTFSTRTMLPWQISFYSGERIYARTSFITGRFAPHQDAVNTAYKTGRKTAVIGFPEDAAHFGFRAAYPDPCFFVCTDLPPAKLRLLFMFPE